MGVKVTVFKWLRVFGQALIIRYIKLTIEIQNYIVLPVESSTIGARHDFEQRTYET